MHASLLERSNGKVHACKRKTENRGQLKEKTALDSAGGFQIPENAKSGKNENSSWLAQSHSESFSEKVSVTRIITNYFSELEDVDSLLFSAENYIKNRGLTFEKSIEKSVPVPVHNVRNVISDSKFDSPVEFPARLEEYEVGERLVIAKKKVGLSMGHKLSKASTFVPKKGKLMAGQTFSPFMYSVFDITDSDD